MNIARRTPRAYSLVVVMMTLGLITVSMLSLWAYLEAGARVTGEAVRSRQNFYACDGAARIVGRLIGKYLAGTTTAPTAADAEAYVVGAPELRLQTLMPSTVTVDTLEIREIENVGDIAVPNGPFEGMIGREATLRFRLRMREATADFACEIEKTLALSELGLFQFGVFVALDDVQLAHRTINASGATTSTITGRVHLNGDGCTGSAPGHDVLIQKITAGGTLRATPTHCAQGPAASSHATIGVAGGGAANRVFSEDITAHAADWVAYADGHFGARLRDQPFGVGALRIPSSGRVQSAQTAGAGSEAQRGSLRFLVDPPLGLSVETEAEMSTKLAYVADLRIIDGVWYKKNTSAPNDWPGVPIWSDHPGSVGETVNASFTRRDGTFASSKMVGQGDLAAVPALGWAGRVPKRYSYYGYDATAFAFEAGLAAELPMGATAPVISYGSMAPRRTYLVAEVHDIMHVPAVTPRLVAAGGNSDHCGTAVCTTDLDCPVVEAVPAVAANDAWCAARNRSSNLAGAAGGTFIDPHLFNGVHRRVLPVNFDVEALQHALEDTTAGELGAHFPDADGDGAADFNGVVWISSLWPDAWNGFNGTSPARIDAPFRAVPFPLCSDATSLAGQNFDGAVASTTIPSCAAQLALAGGVRPWPNAVRIVNARNVNYGLGASSGQLPNGLTIASNLPVYIHGDVNRTSSPAATAAAASVAADWVPMLIAGDTTTFVSNRFENRVFTLLSFVDASIGSGTGAYPTAAVDTTYNLAVLTSIPRTAAPATRAVDLKAATRWLENWGAVDFRISGSLAIGYNPVYAGAWDGGETTRHEYVEVNAPNQVELFFDHRMNTLAAQPPGGISFDVQAVRQWERN